MLVAACGGKPVATAPSANGALPLLPAGSSQLVTAYLNENTPSLRGVHRLQPAPGTQGGVLMQAQHSESGANSFTDTMVFNAKGLVPIWERMYSHSAAHSVVRRIEYHGPQIHVVSQVNDSAPTSVDLAASASALAFNQLEWVMRSLPLRAGYRALVPLYSEGDNAMELDTVQVLGRAAETGPQRSHWRVRFADRMIYSVYYLDEQTRGVDSVRGGRQATAPAH
jgi:hypothetical protein